MNRWIELVERAGPVRAAFVGSLLLSSIALWGTIAPNNDGMLYVEAARLFQQDGIEAASQVFDWLFLPILMGVLSSLTGLDAETAGYLLSTLFVAGTCALIVACARDRFPEAGWAACAVVLALPVMNNYRDHIIREFGAWFFLFLAFWLALRWVREPAWGRALLLQLSICAAALFRLESLVFLAVFPLWQLYALRQPGGWSRLAMMSAFLCPGLVGLVLFLSFNETELSGRIAMQIHSLDPARQFAAFSRLVDDVAGVMPHEIAASQSHLILLYGVLLMPVVKFVSNFGVFLLPVGYVFLHGQAADLIRRWAPFSYAFLVYLVTLAVFVLDQFFMTGRYVALLNLFAIPLVAVGVLVLYRRYPRWRWAMTLIIVVAALSNVVSTTPPKMRHVDAANWLAAQDIDPERAYVEPVDVLYLAGWSYSQKANRESYDLPALAKAMHAGSVDLALLEGSVGDDTIERWTTANDLAVVARFADRRNRKILGIKRQESEAPDHEISIPHR